MLRLHDVGYPVTSLGPGRRIGIWFQGCTIGCRGCMSLETWSASGGRVVAVDEVVAWCESVRVRGVDGITISGGEPFEQPQGLADLLDALDRWRGSAGAEIDLLCYSGLGLARLRRDHDELLGRLDAVIPEPFLVGRPGGGRWRGSDNQPVVALSDLGRARYGSIPEDGGTPIQVSAGGSTVRIVGIPHRNDLEDLDRATAARGLVVQSEGPR